MLYLFWHWLQQSKAKNHSVAEWRYLPQWKQNSVTNLTEKTKPDGGGREAANKKKHQKQPDPVQSCSWKVYSAQNIWSQI